MKDAKEWAEQLLTQPAATDIRYQTEQLVREIQMDAISRNYGDNAIEPEKPKLDPTTENMRQRVWAAAYEAALTGSEFQKSFAPQAAEKAVALFDAKFNLPTSIFHRP